MLNLNRDSSRLSLASYAQSEAFGDAIRLDRIEAEQQELTSRIDLDKDFGSMLEPLNPYAEEAKSESLPIIGVEVGDVSMKEDTPLAPDLLKDLTMLVNSVILDADFRGVN